MIYFLISLSRALKESNEDLKKQLLHERTEEKRKIYAMAGGGKEQNNVGPTMPEVKKVLTDHLPLKEKQRREPWHNKKTEKTDGNFPPESGEESSSESERDRSPLTSPGRPRCGGGGESGKFPIPPGFIPSLHSLPEETASEDSDVEKGKLHRTKSETQIKIPLASPEDSCMSALSKSSPAVTPVPERRDTPSSLIPDSSEAR